MNRSTAPSTPLPLNPAHQTHEPQSPPSPAPVNLEEESVAGEEDPGAALDLPKPTHTKPAAEKPER